MDAITIQSEAFKAMINKLDKTYDLVQKCIPLLNKVFEIEKKSDQEWLDAHEAAKILKISRRTLQRLKSAGEVNYFLIGRRPMFYASEIYNYHKTHHVLGKPLTRDEIASNFDVQIKKSKILNSK